MPTIAHNAELVNHANSSGVVVVSFKSHCASWLKALQSAPFYINKLCRRHLCINFIAPSPQPPSFFNESERKLSRSHLVYSRNGDRQRFQVSPCVHWMKLVLWLLRGSLWFFARNARSAIKHSVLFVSWFQSFLPFPWNRTLVVPDNIWMLLIFCERNPKPSINFKFGWLYKSC